jgi:hypothetical protein
MEEGDRTEQVKQRALYSDFRVKLLQQPKCIINGCKTSNCIIRYKDYEYMYDIKAGATLCYACACDGFVNTDSFTTFTIHVPAVSAAFNVMGNADSFTVDWGDGSFPEHPDYTYFTLNHNYTKKGPYTISIYDTSNITSLAYTAPTASATDLYLGAMPTLKEFTLQTSLSTTLNVAPLSNLSTLKLLGTQVKTLNISALSNLTALTITPGRLSTISIIPNSTLKYLNLTNNTIHSTFINTLLSVLVTNNVSGGVAYLQQTPVAPPLGQGLTDKATLISRGWTVITD